MGLVAVNLINVNATERFQLTKNNTLLTSDCCPCMPAMTKGDPAFVIRIGHGPAADAILSLD